MGCHGLIVLTALLLLTTEYEVSAQYTNIVECLPAAIANTARPILQAGGQYILPAIIQPIIPNYDCYAPEPPTPPSYPNYGNYPAPNPGYPPIIVDNGRDFWRDLLYLLVFTLQNDRINSNNNPQYNCGCNSCNCRGSCNCCCCCNDLQNNKVNDNSNSMPTYIPIPIAIPVFMGSDGYPVVDSFPGFCNDLVIQGGCSQPCNGKEPNEINLIIRADC